MKKNDLEKISKLGFKINKSGHVHLSGKAQKVYEKWIDIISEHFKTSSTILNLNPLIIEKEILEDSKYSSHFPHQLLNVISTKNNPIGYCTPASCLHTYAQLKNTTISNPLYFITRGTCARYEQGKWDIPFRLPFFTMLEYVVIGDEKHLENIKEEVSQSVKDMFKTYHINFKEDFATDAFFLEEDRGAKIIQKLKGLKKEFIGKTGEYSTALASLNYHEDYFGRNFSINCKEKPAFSMCMAFGIERLTAYSLLTWTKNTWPNIFKL